MRRKHPGRPAVFDDPLEDWAVAWLVSIPTMIPREPIRVRLRPTEHGWKGWYVGGSVASQPTHWFAHQWHPANTAENAALDEQYGTETEVYPQHTKKVCDATHSTSSPVSNELLAIADELVSR